MSIPIQHDDLQPLVHGLPNSGVGSSDSDSRQSTGVDRQNTMSAQSSRCLTQADIATEGHIVCPISHKRLALGDQATELQCGHIFSPPAISEWLRVYSNTCPVCRAEVGSATPPRAQPASGTPGPRATSAQLARQIEVLSEAILDQLTPSVAELRYRRASELRLDHLSRRILRDLSELRDMGYDLNLTGIRPTVERQYRPGDLTRYTLQMQGLAAYDIGRQ